MHTLSFVKTTVILFFIGTLASCASSVYTDYDTTNDFSKYQNFEWLGSKTEGEPYEAFGGDIFDTRLQQAIENTLSFKGMNNEKPAEFSIQYTLVTKEREYYTDDFYYGRFYLHNHPYFYAMYNPYYSRQYHRRSLFGPHYTNRVRYYTVGTLTVQVVDNAKGKVVWSSKARTIVSEKRPPAENVEKINELAQKMFAQFPPNNVITL